MFFPHSARKKNDRSFLELSERTKDHKYKKQRKKIYIWWYKSRGKAGAVFAISYLKTLCQLTRQS